MQGKTATHEKKNGQLYFVGFFFFSSFPSNECSYTHTTTSITFFSLKHVFFFRDTLLQDYEDTVQKQAILLTRQQVMKEILFILGTLVSINISSVTSTN